MSNKMHIEINTIKNSIRQDYKLRNITEVEEMLDDYNISYYTSKGKVKQYSIVKKEIDEKIEERKLKNYHKNQVKNAKAKLCIEIANFVIENKATVNETCEHFDITRKRYYKYKDELLEIDKELHKKVQMVAESNKSNNLIVALENTLEEQPVVKKKNDEIIIDSLDEKIQILKPAFEILVDLVKNYNDYETLLDDCIKKMDTQKDGEYHKIENEYNEDFDCCDSVYRQYDYQTKRRVFKDFKNFTESIKLLNLETIKNANYQLKKYKDDTRDYRSYDEKLRNLNDNINKTRMKLGIVEE